jgi:hypothetical protein
VVVVVVVGAAVVVTKEAQCNHLSHTEHSLQGLPSAFFAFSSVVPTHWTHLKHLLQSLPTTKH